MSKRDADILYFVAFCLEGYKNKHGLTGVATSVHANRTQRDFAHDYDLVYGPVANDRVYAAFALYEQGLLDKQELIAELKTYKLIDQMLFHTEESLKCLRFIEAREVRP